MSRHKKQIQQAIELLQAFITQGYIKVNDQFVPLKQLLSITYNNVNNTTQTIADNAVVDIKRNSRIYKITRNDVLETIKVFDFSKYRRAHYYAIVNGAEYPAHTLISKTIEYKYNNKRSDIKLVQAIIALQKLGFEVIYKRKTKNTKPKEKIRKPTFEDNTQTIVRIKDIPYSLAKEDIKHVIEQNIKLPNKTKYIVRINGAKYPIRTLVSSALSLKYGKSLKVSLWQAILALHRLGFDVEKYIEEIRANHKKQ